MSRQDSTLPAEALPLHPGNSRRDLIVRACLEGRPYPLCALTFPPDPPKEQHSDCRPPPSICGNEALGGERQVAELDEDLAPALPQWAAQAKVSVIFTDVREEGRGKHKNMKRESLIAAPCRPHTGDQARALCMCPDCDLVHRLVSITEPCWPGSVLVIDPGHWLLGVPRGSYPGL